MILSPASKTILWRLKLHPKIFPLILKTLKIHTSYTFMKKNYYDVLQLAHNAKQSEIKEAYYRLSMIHHPDQSKDDEKMTETFKDIVEAYEVLGDVHRRRRYDKGSRLSSGFVAEDIEVTGLTKKKATWHHEDKSTSYSSSSSSRTLSFDTLTNQNRKSAFERRLEFQKNYKKYERDIEDFQTGSQSGFLIVGGFLILALIAYVTNWNGIAESREDKLKKLGKKISDSPT